MRKDSLTEEESRRYAKDGYLLINGMHPRYTPLVKVPDSAILQAGLKRFQETEEEAADWLQPKADRSAVSLERPA
jgi:hypothetical protein